MKNKCFYIPLVNGVFNGVFVNYKANNLLCLSVCDEIKFDKSHKDISFFSKIKKLWFVRGLFLFFYNLYVYFKTYDTSLKLYLKGLLKKDIEYRKYKKKQLVNFRWLLTFFVFIFYVFLPFWFYGAIHKHLFGVWFEVLRIAFKFVITSCFLLVVGKLSITKNIFKNSAAINSVVNDFKSKDEIIYKNNENRLNNSVFNFSTSFVTTFFLVYAFVPLVDEKSVLLEIVFKILLTILIICIAYEIQLGVQCKYKKSKMFKVFGWLFVYFSKLTTKKPNEKQVYLARVAMEEILQMNFNEEVEDVSFDTTPVSLFYSKVKATLVENDIDVYEAKHIICDSLGITNAEFIKLKNFTPKQCKIVKKVLNERIKHKPICKILGYKHFYGLKFKVNKYVLSPRNETEILVEELLNELKNNGKNQTVLDMCTGSGAIAIAVSKNSKAKVVAVDKSKRALQVAMFNAKNLDADVEFFQGDMFKHLKDENKFDIIACNPPYIESKEIENLEKEVKENDPKMALDGGKDGLKFYKMIASDAPKFLKKQGKLFLEIGYDQAESVTNLLKDYFKDIIVIEDYSGLPRVIKAVKK